jgi:hypothetical protein
MTKIATGPLVTLEALGGELGGGPVEYVRSFLAIQGLQMQIVEDWKGTPSVPASVAAEAVAAYRAEQQERAAKLSAYDAYQRQREADRAQAGLTAYEKAARKQLRREWEALAKEFVTAPSGITLSPAGREIARQAQVKALEEFDRKHPLALLEDFKA